MSNFPFSGPVQPLRGGGGHISTGNILIGMHSSTASTFAWPAANRAVFIPIRVPAPVTIYKFTIGAGATATGNVDVGVYSASGVRAVSSGTTAKLSTAEQVIEVTDTPIGPGIYFLALSADGLINVAATSLNLQQAKLLGILQMDSAFVLPAVATFASLTGVIIPQICAHLRPL